MKAALALTLADRWAVLSGIVVAFGAVIFFVLGGQMVTVGTSGIVVLATSGKVAIFVILSLLVGVSVALQVAAVRIRTAGRGKAAGVMGFAFAFVGASCCTPLIWPAVLSFFGVSGVTLLGINIELHRWFWFAVALAAISLVFGIWTSVRAMMSACRIEPAPPSLSAEPAGKPFS